MKLEDIKSQVSVERLLSHLGSSEKNRKWRCLFPRKHNNGDQHHSVDIYQGRAYCRSRECFGPKGADIFEIVGLVENLPSFAKQKPWIEKTFALTNGRSQQFEILRVYEWTDSNGRKAYHLRTTDPHHKFRWNQSPDGSGPSTLVPCAPDLYQRNRVQAAKKVIVCAGERDADTINGWLQETGKYPETVATSPYSGETSVKAERLSLLFGKGQVYVMGDNDKTGEAYREKVVECLQAQVGTLYPLWVPQEFNDVTEWAENGGSAQDFKNLLDGATAFTPNDKENNGLKLTSLGDLLAEPDEEVDWLVENLLPRGGVSVIGGKPKAGKSTTVRNLVLSIAKGEPFLNFHVTQGPVIYCAFEEKRSEVQRHFRDLGADGSLPIFTFIEQAPNDIVEKIRASIQVLKPVLIVLDTLARVTKAKDFNDYAQMSKALDPFLNMARETGSHLLFVHHAVKGERSGGDALLGSTAIFGTVDTALMQKRSEKYRTLEAICRYGHDLEETVLEWDDERRAVTLGGSRQDTDVSRIKKDLWVFLRTQEEPVTRESLEGATEGKTTLKRLAIKQLVEAQEVSRLGKGGKGSPFTYSLASKSNNEFTCPDTREDLTKQKGGSLVPDICGEQGNKHSQNGQIAHEYGADSCSQNEELFNQLAIVQKQDSLSILPTDYGELFDLDA